MPLSPMLSSNGQTSRVKAYRFDRGFQVNSLVGDSIEPYRRFQVEQMVSSTLPPRISSEIIPAQSSGFTNFLGSTEIYRES